MSRPSLKVSLISGDTGGQIEGHLFEGLTDENLKHHVDVWIPTLQEHNRQVKDGKRDGVLAEDAAWNWEKKVKSVEKQTGFRHYAIEADGFTQGLMTVRLIGHTCVIEAPKSALYVEYLAVAPENRENIRKPARFRAVGSLLLLQAVDLSKEEGFEGRIGLHSLPGAANWYTKRGLQSCGPDTRENGLEYFDLTTERAKALLEKASH